MARQQQDVDELFDVKNAFYVGNYQQAINEAQNVNPSSPLVALQRDTFLYRSYIAQNNFRIVLQELKNADPMLQPLKTLVEYLSPGANKPAIVADIDARVAKALELPNEVFLIVAATIYYHEDNYEAALKILHGAESLELRAFTLQCLLAMNRPDLARKQLKSLQDIEDDSTLTQLAQAWLNLSEGGPGVQDAHFSIMELSERLGALGAGPAAAGAAAAASRGMWEEAEQMLTEAQSRLPQQPELLLALGVSAAHSGKPPEEYIIKYYELSNELTRNKFIVYLYAVEVGARGITATSLYNLLKDLGLSRAIISSFLDRTSKAALVSERYFAQLLDSHPDHPFTKEYNAKANEFKRLAAQYQPSVPS